MATLITKTIGTGGDYTTYALFEAALPADLTVSDEIWQATVLDGTSAGGTMWTGTVCDATRYVVVKAYRASAAYAGMWGSPTGAVNGAITLSGAALVIYFYDVGFYSSATNGVSVTGTAAVAYFVRCTSFGHTSVSTGNGFNVNAAGASITCDWCLTIDVSNEGTAAGFHCLAGTATFRNCTHVGSGIGFKRTAGTCAATNCYSASSDSADYSGTITKTTCYSTDTTASGDATNQITLANAGFRARRHPSLVAYVYGWNWDDGKNVFAKRDNNAPGVLVGGRMNSTASLTAVGATGGDGADNSNGTYTGTTGYRKWPSTGGIKMPLGTADRTIVARLRISSGPAANTQRGLMWVWDEATANDTFCLRTDASGYFVCEVTDASGDSTVATSTTKIGDLANGDHDIRGVLAGNTLTIYVNGVSTGTGDATGKVTFTSPIAATTIHRGHYFAVSDFYLGANAALLSGSAVFAAAVTQTGELPQIADNAGWCHDVRPTRASDATIKGGGTAWASPGTDLLGRDIGAQFPVGCCAFVETEEGGPEVAGSRGLFGHSVLSAYGGNSGFNSYFG